MSKFKGYWWYQTSWELKWWLVLVPPPSPEMLAGDYPCYFYLGSDRDEDTSCPLCQALSPDRHVPQEDMVHLLTQCRGTADTRTRVTPEFLNTISMHFRNNTILQYPNHTHLTQLILDPTSLNLPMNICIKRDHPALPHVLTICRTLCHAIHQNQTAEQAYTKTTTSTVTM